MLLALCDIVQASFLKMLWNTVTAKGDSTSVVDAYTYVHKIAHTLYGHGEDREGALQCEGRAIHIARSSPLLVKFKCRPRDSRQ